MQSASSRIRTRVAVSISYDDNHYTTGTSKPLLPELNVQKKKKNTNKGNTKCAINLVAPTHQSHDTP